jgi:hypothetical protein
VAVLQTAAFPLRHCIELAREAGVEPAAFRVRAGRTADCATPVWSGWLVTIQRPPRPKRGALPTELHPVSELRDAFGQPVASHPGWLRV